MQESPPTGEMRLRRLRWLCRRGMKELDVLLESFIAQHARALQDGAWPELEDLLALEDDQLWDSLLDPKNKAAAKFQDLLTGISHGSAKPD